MDFVWQVMLFAAATTFTPGPNVLILTASGANFGFMRTLPPMLGVCLGIPALIIAVGAGLGAVFQAFPIVHWILQIAGTAYLVWLAWKIAMTRSIGEREAGARPITFVQAAAFQWVNPKVWMMALGAISAYTSVGGNVMREALLIAAIFGFVCIPAATVWTLFGVGIRRWLKSPRGLRTFNLLMAALLLASVAFTWIR